MSLPNKKIRVVVIQIGARMHYAVPLLLHRAGLLNQMITDVYTGKGSVLHLLHWLPKQVQKGGVKRLLQRQTDLPASKVTPFNRLGIEFVRRLKEAQKTQAFTIHEVALWFGERFGKEIVRHERPQIEEATAVYCFTRSGYELFQLAKELGKITVLEQMRAPMKELVSQVNQENERWPGWQRANDQFANKPEWYEAEETRQLAEWEMADRIIAPSSYVRDKLVDLGVSTEKIALIPYAVSMEHFVGKTHQYDGQRPLRVIFVGTVNLRKGVPDLLEALRILGADKVEARFVGTVELIKEKLEPYQDVAQFLGRLPRHDVVEQYDWADLFVLPSVSEGSATVTYEARACGLPVVATPNAGAWIEDGVDGFLVPVRDPEQLAQTLERFIEQPELIKQLSEASLIKAPEFSWEAYQSRLSQLFVDLHQ